MLMLSFTINWFLSLLTLGEGEVSDFIKSVPLSTASPRDNIKMGIVLDGTSLPFVASHGIVNRARNRWTSLALDSKLHISGHVLLRWFHTPYIARKMSSQPVTIRPPSFWLQIMSNFLLTTFVSPVLVLVVSKLTVEGNSSDSVFAQK